MTAKADNGSNDHDLEQQRVDSENNDGGPQESAAGDSSTTEPEQDEFTALRSERDRLDDQLKRAMADLANFKRRQLQEAETGRRAALEGVMGDLVNVLDIFGHALAAYDGIGEGTDQGAVESLVQGVRMTQTMLQQSLERHGLQEIPALGQPFDPNIHEATGFDPESDVQEGHVAKVLSAGYRLRDKVLRASRVLVAGSNPEPSTAEENA